MLEDFSRRGFLDGRAVRLPGIVARPLEPSGLISAFMSDVMRCLSAGEAFTCPVSPEAVMWWMSAQCCAQNLIHAATMPIQPDSSRVTLLPALRATMREIVAGIAELYGSDRLELIRYEPNEPVEAGFGRLPPMDSSAAEALGFQHDDTVLALIQRALVGATDA
jgi:D-erythronate 2-dehydrogenase